MTSLGLIIFFQVTICLEQNMEHMLKILVTNKEKQPVGFDQ